MATQNATQKLLSWQRGSLTSWSPRSHFLFPKYIQPYERDEEKGSDSQSLRTLCLRKIFQLTRGAWDKRVRNKSYLLIPLLPSPHCARKGEKQPLKLDVTLRFSWFRAQMTQSNILIMLFPYMTKAWSSTLYIKAAFFFPKCIHCSVTYLLRSLTKGQQS